MRFQPKKFRLGKSKTQKRGIVRKNVEIILTVLKSQGHIISFLEVRPELFQNTKYIHFKVKIAKGVFLTASFVVTPGNKFTIEYGQQRDVFKTFTASFGVECSFSTAGKCIEDKITLMKGMRTESDFFNVIKNFIQGHSKQIQGIRKSGLGADKYGKIDFWISCTGCDVPIQVKSSVCGQLEHMHSRQGIKIPSIVYRKYHCSNDALRRKLERICYSFLKGRVEHL